MAEKTKILFVDDDVRILSSFERVVYPHRGDWECYFENDSTKVLSRLLSDTFDIVVTDVKMPEIDGLELLREIKKDARLIDLEVIVVTGVGDRSFKRKALDLGAADLLSKPISNEELVSRIKSAARVKSYRDELIQKNKTLEDQLVSIQKMEVIGVLAGGAVHDLNSILGIIQGYGNLIMQKNVTIDSMRDDFKVIMDSVDRAISITRQIHSFSDISSHTNQIVDLRELLFMIRSSLLSTLGKNTDIRIEVDEGGKLIRAFEGSVYQVFMNVCINAIQAMGGVGKLDIRVFEGEQGVVCVEFEDSGGGIPEEIIDKLFQPLVTTKHGSGGSGLGLAIVKRLMTQMDGQVEAKNGNEGAIFRLSFPAN